MRSLILGPTVRRFGESGVMRIGLVGLAAGFALQALAPTLLTYAGAIILIPVGTALLFPASSSSGVALRGQRHELGATMGVQQAYGGVARLVGPVWAGLLFQHVGISSPFWVAAALVAAVGLFSRTIPSAASADAEAPVEPA